MLCHEQRQKQQQQQHIRLDTQFSGWNWYCVWVKRKIRINGKCATVYDPYNNEAYWIEGFIFCGAQSHANPDYAMKTNGASLSLNFYHFNEIEIATAQPKAWFICIL